MDRNVVIPWSTLVLFCICVLINGLSATGKGTGKSAGAVSDVRPNSFVPAGWAFSIWSLIYISLGAYCVFAVLPRNRGHKVVVDQVSWLLALNFVFNTCWIFAWGYESFWLSVAIMAGILGTLLAIYRRVDVHYIRNQGRHWSTSSGAAVKDNMTEDASVIQQQPNQSSALFACVQFWILQFPFSLYLGWISVATIANVAAAIADPGFVPSVGTNSGWSAGMQTVAALLGLAMLYQRRDFVYNAVLVWALFAIRDKQAHDPVVHTSASVLAALLLVTLLVAATDVLWYYVANAFPWLRNALPDWNRRSSFSKIDA